MLIYLKISKKNTLITQGNKKIKCGRWDLKKFSTQEIQ